jgi:hypothetical protein
MKRLVSDCHHADVEKTCPTCLHSKEYRCVECKKICIVKLWDDGAIKDIEI